MKPDHLGGFPLIEVAADRIAHLLAKFLHSFGFRKNRFAKGAGAKPAFRRFLDDEDQFVHDLLAKSDFTMPGISLIRH